MPERDEWQQLAGFAQHAAVFTDPRQIKAIATRRNRRRRASQAVLGTGALAAVAFLGTGLATSGLGNGHGAVGAGGPVTGAGGSATAPAGVRATAKASATASASHAGSGGVTYALPTNVSESRESALLTALHLAGFVDVSTRSVGSSTVPAGNAVDITDVNGRSVLGDEVSTSTPLIVVVSAGPAH